MNVGVKRIKSFMKLRSSKFARLAPNQTMLISTGIYIESVAASFVFPAVRSNIFICPGVIDPDYRGEVKVIAVNKSSRDIEIAIDTKLAYLVFTQPITPSLSESPFINFNCTNLLPQRATKDSVGYDLYSDVTITIPAKETTAISTGVAFDVASDIWSVVFPRSGFMAKGIVSIPQPISNGEPIIVKLHNYTDTDFVILKNTRVAQFVLFKKSTDKNAIDFDYISENNNYTFGRGTGQQIETCTLNIKKVTELSNTARGDNGFGSTGTAELL